ncbi:MAG TPA: putative Ig domain-containing protein, partial [Moraxellaceae bacterium]|nr:putative Ig domain-containing protein [Moraxellaceae bacterium]
MYSRLLAGAALGVCLALSGGEAQATATYYGTEGVYAKLFSSNSQQACTACHTSTITDPATRSYAPAEFNFDTYAGATAYSPTYAEYVDAGARVRAAQDGGMPPTGVNLTDAEHALIEAWASQRSGGTAPPDYAKPEITGIGATSVSKYSATLNATVNDGGSDASYVLEWRKTSDVGYPNSATYYTTSGGATTVSTNSATWTGGGASGQAIARSITTTCGTDYQYRVRSSTNVKGSTTSSVGSFTTSACPSLTSITGSYILTEDQSFSLTVNTSGGVSSYSLIGAPSGMSISAGGVISWPAASTPDSPTSDTFYNFTIRVGDGTTSSDYAGSVTVTPVNDPPVISSSANTVASEGVAYSYTVTATDTEGASLSYSLTTKPTGMTINSSTGAISWTPPNQTASYTANVTVQVSDGSLTDTQSFTINVTASNQSPVFSSSAVTSGTESTAYTYNAAATDADGTTLTYSLPVKPTGMTINSSTGAISWTPPEALSNYSQNVTVRASDGVNNTDQSYSITVSANNDAPSYTSVDVTSGTENIAYQYDVDASDPESQTLTYSLPVKPTGMTINSSTGVIDWTPPDQAADYTANVTVRVTDGTSNVDRSFVITVSSTNGAPSFTSTAVTSATEAVAYSYTAAATDPEGGSLSYSLITKPSGMTINASSGLINWTPPQALADNDQLVTVQVTDGANPVTQSFTITVSADNDAPSFTSVNETTVAEDTAYQYDLNATDPEGQTLTYALTTKPSGMTINASTGVVDWTPPLNANAVYNVTATVSDGTNTVSNPWTITVTPVNDAPTFTSSAVTSVTEDTAYSYDVNASDVDGDTLTYSLTTKPTGMTIDAGTGVISWTPPLDSNASVNVTVQVSDGTVPVPQSFTIGITPVNDQPAITSTAVTADDGAGGYSYDVNASDVDGDTLYYSLVTAPTGMTIDAGTGVIGWSVPVTLSNPYSVTVRVDDRSNGSGLSDTQSFSITVADGDSDTIADYADNCVGVANTSQLDTDGDGAGNACDADDDNDGLPDTVEVANGLNPLDAADAALDLNGDGVSNLDAYLACGGSPTCYAISNPVIVTNGDQVVTATGYLTPVTLTATATGVSGPLTVTADNPGPFRPGVHTVTWTAPWTAPDSSPQVATTTQQVTVRPLVSLGGSGVAGTGQTVYVPVRLNGEAPAYPVVVTINASGAQDGVDYTL